MSCKGHFHHHNRARLAQKPKSRNDTPLQVSRPTAVHYFLSLLSVDSYHCLVFFALSCASKNTFLKCGFNVRREKKKKTKPKLTLSLGHLEALSEHQRRVTGLSTTSRGPKCGEMLRLVNDFDEAISKSLPARPKV